MTKGTAWFVHVSAACVAGTGIVYGWMRYFSKPDDPYAIANHPLQPTFQYAHILVAPFVVFACGMLWRNHVWGRVRSGHRKKRRTGLVLTAALIPMIASGYLLQVSSSELARDVWVVVHVATSCLWTLAYVWHQFFYRRGVVEVRSLGAEDASSPVRRGLG